MLKEIFEKVLANRMLSDDERLELFAWLDKTQTLVLPPAQQITLQQTNVTPLLETVRSLVVDEVKARIPNLSTLSNQLGLQIAGEFRTGNGIVPGNGFTGGRFGYPGFTYNNEEWFLVGVEDDVLKVGLNISDGKLYAEEAVISGTITAASGTIGGWEITSSAIRKLSSNVGIVLDSSTPKIQVGDTSSTHIVLDGALKVVKSSNFSSGATGFQIAADTGDAEFNNITARGELKTFLLTSSNQMAVAGNIIVSKDAGKLGAAVSSGATTVNFGKAMTVGDWIKIQGPDSAGSNNLEWMLIGSLVSGTTYNVTRNVDGSGANGWLKDTPFVVIGTNGDSRIELVAGASGSIQLITQGAAWNTQTVQASMSTVAGAITAGGGDVTIDSQGIWTENQEAAFGFKDTSGNRGTLLVYSGGVDEIGFSNHLPGKGIIGYITLTDTSRVATFWSEDSVANRALFQIPSGAQGVRVKIGAGVFIMADKDGYETVFNENSYDVDFRVEGATNPFVFVVDAGNDRVEFRNSSNIAQHIIGATRVYFNEPNGDVDFSIEGQTDGALFYVDASADKIGIGKNNPSYKLDVVGDVNVSGGFYVGGVAFTGGGGAQNNLFNGGFNFAQRQAPGTLTTIADKKYGPDRWMLQRENADLQYKRFDAIGETGLKSRYYGQLKKITNAGKWMMFQVVENFNTQPLLGQSMTFEIKMRASANKTIRMAILELQNAGTADTLPGTAVSAWGADSTDPTLGTNLAIITSAESKSVTTSATWQKFSVTKTIPTNSKNVICAVWSDADFAANDTINFAEAGLYTSAPSNWSERPAQEELALCQRYFESSYDIDVAPGTTTTGGDVIQIFCGAYATTGAGQITYNYKVTKRTVTPTMTYYLQAGTAGSFNYYQYSGGVGGTSAVSTHKSGQHFVTFFLNSCAGLTVGATVILSGHLTADSEIY